MSNLAHTYGNNCRIAPVVRPPHSDAFDDTPPILAQFFYTSVLTIDDPLSHGTLAGASDPKVNKGRLRPFSEGDNNALETAWLSAISDEDGRVHREAMLGRNQSLSITKANDERLAYLVRSVAARHLNKHNSDLPTPTASVLGSGAQPSIPTAVCCPELFLDVLSGLQNTFCALVRKRQRSLDLDNVVQAVMVELKLPLVAAAEKAVEEQTVGDGRLEARNRASSSPTSSTSQPKLQPASSSKEAEAALGRPRCDSQRGENLLRPHSPTTAIPRTVVDDGISGTPFIRVGTPNSAAESATPLAPQNDKAPEPLDGLETGRARPNSVNQDGPDVLHKARAKEVAVGISRLHMVSIPALQMKPIYWSPVNDMAVVMRATWFYRDTMLPVPAEVANQLEVGYRELRPYTETWNDELRCAIDVGSLGEEKVSHQLWPTDKEQPGGDRLATDDSTISTDPFCAARCFRGEAAAQGSIDSGPGSGSSNPLHRSFSGYHVIYQDGARAFLLKPSLRPSGYYGRRPVAKIMKGITVGIPVIRGFDRAAWERLYRKKTTLKDDNWGTGTDAGASNHAELPGCVACQAQKTRGQINDLVLVCHGIGQKFAERVESFHFTHTINAFRREVNLELGNPAVQAVLREGQNGIMVLPVNWRHSLSFEDGGPMSNADKSSHSHEGFGLKDIEPTTIPAIRSLFSDVMFDIPFFMSHHKGKMIKALVKEANRVYRLWCQNNPGFHLYGRVHLIGHSLGSAMAIEILSRQPNQVPPLDLTSPIPRSSIFEFNTTNLFLAGSPAGFFLLLEKGALVPRRGRPKPGADSSDINDPEVTREAGFFGCLSVDNVYNILAKEDPIAYLLNGTIDPAYAAGLKTAYVPSTATSLFKYVGDTMKTIIPGLASAASSTDPITQKPAPIRLPSQLELEVHDFTREELAERKAYLLNDNGQIDYYLHSSGGPLEIQYLNMLSAHSSYWLSRDFIRMLCTEVGRQPGRAYSMPALKAEKSTKRIIGHNFD